ncbi:MAG: hypothetical protein ACYTFI_07115 [Planctomycetota bacterium]|jgi:hypothetical protein
MRYKRAASFGLLAVVALLGITREAYAPIYGPFPGLTKLIDRADVIAVVMIVQGGLGPLGIHGDYDVRVLKTLKGELPRTNMTLSLRHVPFLTATMRASRLRFRDSDFIPWSRHIVFLREVEGRPVGFDQERIKRVGPSFYQSLNCAGGHMPVSPSWRPSRNGDGSVRATIAALVRGYVNHKRAELRHVEERAKMILGKLASSPDPTAGSDAAGGPEGREKR